MSYTTSDLSRRSGDIIAEALRGPVTITQRNKPRLVILSVEEYGRLKQARPDSRRAYRTEDMPEDLLAEIEKAVAGYAREDGD